MRSLAFGKDQLLRCVVAINTNYMHIAMLLAGRLRNTSDQSDERPVYTVSDRRWTFWGEPHPLPERLIAKHEFSILLSGSIFNVRAELNAKRMWFLPRIGIGTNCDNSCSTYRCKE